MTPRPADLGLRRQVATPLVRAILAHARVSYTGENIERLVGQLWPRDAETLNLVTRAATAQAELATPGWAPELGQNIVADLLLALGPASAGSQILRQANMLSLDRFSSITVPGLVASAQNASFIQEGQPIPIRQLDTSKKVTLQPRKFATGFVLSREIIASSNAEALVRMVLINSVGLSLDVALFGTAAGTAAAPPGLLYNITPITPATGGSNDSLRQDLGNLAGAVATIGGLDLVFVADPASAVKILGSVGPRFTFPVLASAALAATKSVVCLAPIAIVAAADPSPTIQEAREAVVHMSDTPSDPIMAGQPVRSLFQIDSSGFRLIFDVDWGLLNPGGISVVNGVTW
jgi:hypothetical protein